MKNDQTTYRPTGRTVIRQIGGDHLLVPVSGGTASENAVFPLNQTAVFVWEKLASGKTIQETTEALTKTFTVDMDRGQVDCEEALEFFLDQNLLEVCEL